MTTLIARILLFITLVPSIAFATEAPQMLGHNFGEATHAEVTASMIERGAAPRDTGVSAFSNGPIMSLGNARALDIDGLTKAILIFDVQRKLVAGQLTLNKSRYDAVVSALKSKYPLVREQRPFVGDRWADFRLGETLITVSSPHMSFEMSVTYRTRAFQRAMDDADRAERQARERQDRSQF